MGNTNADRDFVTTAIMYSEDAMTCTMTEDSSDDAGLTGGTGFTEAEPTTVTESPEQGHTCSS